MASGHSIISDTVEWSGHDQLIGVPGYAAFSGAEHLVARLQDVRTQWFFSWGTKEVGTYKIEAEEQRTAEAIRRHSNVTTVIHDEGHVFPGVAIRSLIENSLLINSQLENTQ